jgi:drug/metabolite transporter (DMT)-like permease
VPAVALALVAAAALLHATWNVFAKRAATAGPAFVWLVDIGSVVLWAPAAAVFAVVQRDDIGRAGVAFAVGSGVLHVGYFLLLQLGYRVGDLSAVYPVARGVGPLLATGGAIVLLGERPSAVALAGAALVCGGVVVLARSGRGGGIGVGVLTGVFIAAYTLWDAHAVADLGMPPLVYAWATTVSESVVLAPVAVRHRRVLRATWTAHRREILGVALLSPLAYVLVLVALTLAPVSHVAPAREMSIVVGAILGGRLLREPDAARRIAAASAVALGVVALTLA